MSQARLSLFVFLSALLIWAPLHSAWNLPPRGDLPVHTFSIVAFDPETKSLGIAVASKYLAVGSAVPWAKAGVGAVATQSYVNVTLGASGLDLLKSGNNAKTTLDSLLKEDKGRDWRQVGIVDAQGEVAAFTGPRCVAWAGSKQAKNVTAQGNLLTGPEVIDAMIVDAGDQAGGDNRGKQSAAILVVREKGGPNGLGDRAVDLRVDDHAQPVTELGRLLKLQGIPIR
jgi:uncharacterized Ntn-hydrolase superfamily protein